jgi:hypothetical protein
VAIQNKTRITSEPMLVLVFSLNPRITCTANANARFSIHGDIRGPLAAGLAGFVAFWAAWPRSSNTSPLAALFALVWSCTYFVTAVLTWRRSRLAGPAFIAAIGLLLFPARFIVPGGQLFLPSCVVILLVAFLGYRYLRGIPQAAA